MNFTDVEKTRDLERELIVTDSPNTRYLDGNNNPPKMCRNLLRFLLAGSLLAFILCSGMRVGDTLSSARIGTPKTPTVRDQQRFQEVLNSIDPSALHEVLHEKAEKYKHGVFREDKTAMAVVHQKAPEVATSLVELAKRQAPSNGTTSVPTVTSTTATTVESTSTVTTPVSSSVVVTSSSEGPPSSSSSTPPESTPGATSESTTAAPTSGDSSPTSDVTPTATDASSTPQDSSSPTDNSSPTVPTSVTSYNIFTTTLPNGKPTTVTQTTVVPAAGQADQTPVGSSSSKTSPGASLQTNGGSSMSLGANAMVGMAGMLLIGVL